MDDERYLGTVRNIVSSKRIAVEYAEKMADEFVAARLSAGGALSRGAYATLFEGKGLLTPYKKTRWSTTQITNMMGFDRHLSEKREGEISDFNYHEGWFKGPGYTDERKLSDQDWIDLRQEYLTALDDIVARAKVACAKMRGDDPTSNTVE